MNFNKGDRVMALYKIWHNCGNGFGCVVHDGTVGEIVDIKNTIFVLFDTPYACSNVVVYDDQVVRI